MSIPYHPLRDSINPESWAVRMEDFISDFSSRQYFLDVGMGKGCLLDKLRHHGKNAYGIDVRTLTNNGLVVADAIQLPFKDACFDVVTETLLFDDMHRLQGKSMEGVFGAIDEIRRVLKRDGIFLTIATGRFIKSYQESRRVDVSWIYDIF